MCGRLAGKESLLRAMTGGRQLEGGLVFELRDFELAGLRSGRNGRQGSRESEAWGRWN